MAYAPTVNDMSGEILARYKFAGDQAMAQGIMSAGNSLAEGLKGMGQKYQENRQEGAMLEGKANAYQEMGMMDMATLDKFATGNLNTKRAIVSGLDSTMFHQMKAHETGMDLAKFGLSQQRVGLQAQRVQMDQEKLDRVAQWMNKKPQPVTLPDGSTGTIFASSPQQNQFIADKQKNNAPKGDPIYSSDGRHWRNSVDDPWKPMPPLSMQGAIGAKIAGVDLNAGAAPAAAPSGGVPAGVPKGARPVRHKATGKYYYLHGNDLIEFPGQ